MRAQAIPARRKCIPVQPEMYSHTGEIDFRAADGEFEREREQFRALRN
jgi:hypothetical protein